MHPSSQEISSAAVVSVPTTIKRDGSSGYSSVPRSVVYTMVYSSGNTMSIPNATLFMLAQFEHLIVHAIPAVLHVIDPVTGVNVKAMSSSSSLGAGNGV